MGDRTKGETSNQRGRHQFFSHFTSFALFTLGIGLAPVGHAQTVSLPAPLSASDFQSFDRQKAELGRLLFYDKILSGNRNIACGTCHHPKFGTSDGLSLGLGEGGQGLGPERVSGFGKDKIIKRVPRNAPALWNLGSKSQKLLMHDGRISIDPIYGNQFNTPAEEWFPKDIDTLLAAQALFPMTSSVEMAGNVGENEVIGATRDRIDAAWPIIAKRVRSISGYGERFVAAFDEIDEPEQVSISHIVAALSDFMTQDFTSFDSPFDAFLAGDETALSEQEKDGMNLFFGDAGCVACHAGPLLSDQGFHALGLPAFGPGRTRKFDPYARDTGRMGETDDLADAYRFRTPMLRNVALTAPYGHNGAYPTLTAMIRHHLDPNTAKENWTADSLTLPDVPWLAKVDFIIQGDRLEMARQAKARDVHLPTRTQTEIAALVAFLNSLTGAKAAKQSSKIPVSVPSGLPID